MTSSSVQRSGSSPGVRKYVWNSMLDGEMNDRYWRERAAGYASREKALKIFLAIMSSSVVASWIVWKNLLPSVWQALAGISALLAVALPVLDYTGQVERASDLRKGWWELTAEYDRIWARIDTSSDQMIEEQLRPLKAKETEMSKIESKYFPRNEGLILKCQKDVLRARGLV